MLLIRFLIIVILSLYIIRSLARILLPMLFQSVINKAQQQAEKQTEQRKYTETKPDDKIKVDYIPEGKKRGVPDHEGDFVDYEEVK